MNDKENPCYQCPDRKVFVSDGKTVTCHSYCERYEKMVEDNAARRAMLNKGRAQYNKEKRDYLDKIERLKKHNWSKRK